VAAAPAGAGRPVTTDPATSEAPRAARPGERPRWPAGLAWGLWLLAVLALAAVPWLDRLLRQAGRPDLVQFTPDTAFPVVAMVSAATVGAVVASRRPRHPVGWLLLAVALSLAATAAAAQVLTWGLYVRPGALPAAPWVSLYYSVIGLTALTSIGLLLLLTPTGSPPSPCWRWLARVLVATPVLLVVVATLTGGPLDPRYQVLGGPFDLRGHGGALLVANQVALAVTTLAVVAAAGSLVVRFRHARGTERLQLRWLALAAWLVALALGAYALAGLAVGVASATTLLGDAVGFSLAIVPVATGAAVLRYRLYDLDRILSRTLAYGLLTVLLGGGYAAVALVLGQLLGRDSSLAVAGATLAVAGLFQPARRRVQAAVDRRFNRRRHDAARIIEGFGSHLRDQVDLDTLTAEVLAVAEQTMQPTRASLWLRPPPDRVAR
ncbi:MAG TPA: hypothetical protein VH016_00425, partial [Actinomycetota bacterium]|nr:hypothetical protein [Actinomycetota bacterium]